MAAWEADTGQANGTWVAWRCHAAAAHAALDERDAGARRWPRSRSRSRAASARRDTLGTALGVLGVVGGDLAQLREACETLARSPLRVEHARALVELGVALDRGGHRDEARERLRDGLERAHRCGATALADRALDALVATGARPRRPALADADALTPSERRVSALAADGMTNKEIAQALFVTVNTVETHLRHSYRKLGINSRAQLAGRLGAGAEQDG